MSNVPSAEIIFLHELFQEYHVNGISSVLSKYIRISGVISEINYREKYCVLEDLHNELRLYIDISLIDYSILKEDEVFQFIGSTNLGFPSNCTSKVTRCSAKKRLFLRVGSMLDTI